MLATGIKIIEMKYCRTCASKLTGRKIYYCSDDCRDAYYRRQGYMLPDWSTISAEIVRENPICQICEQEPSVETHHKVPRRYGGSDDRSNLLAVCHSCNVKDDALIRKQKKQPQTILPISEGKINEIAAEKCMQAVMEI